MDSGSMIYSLKSTIKAALKWEKIHENIMFKVWTEKIVEWVTMTQNDQFKALNINAYTFKAAA